MSPAPGKPQNPKWIVADADALIQLVITEHMSMLRKLKSDYGIQFLVVEAVESELLKVIGDKFPNHLGSAKKAVTAQLLVVMDRPFLAQAMGDAIGSSLYAQASQLGESLYKTVDRGEAYSHAAAIVLGVPILSHDIKAINKLAQDGLVLPRPLLRFFDILAFGVQIGALTYADCDKARQNLLRNKEFVIRCFQDCSFEDGLRVFFARLLDGAHPVVGTNTPNQRNDEGLWLQHV